MIEHHCLIDINVRFEKSLNDENVQILRILYRKYLTMSSTKPGFYVTTFSRCHYRYIASRILYV